MIHVKIDNETTTDRQRYIQTDRDDIRPEATTEQHLSFHGSEGSIQNPGRSASRLLAVYSRVTGRVTTFTHAWLTIFWPLRGCGNEVRVRASPEWAHRTMKSPTIAEAIAKNTLPPSVVWISVGRGQSPSDLPPTMGWTSGRQTPKNDWPQNLSYIRVARNYTPCHPKFTEPM